MRFFATGRSFLLAECLARARVVRLELERGFVFRPGVRHVARRGQRVRQVHVVARPSTATSNRIAEEPDRFGMLASLHEETSQPDHRAMGLVADTYRSALKWHRGNEER